MKKMVDDDVLHRFYYHFIYILLYFTLKIYAENFLNVHNEIWQ